MLSMEVSLSEKDFSGRQCKFIEYPGKKTSAVVRILPAARKFGAAADEFFETYTAGTIVRRHSGKAAPDRTVLECRQEEGWFPYTVLSDLREFVKTRCLVVQITVVVSA